jgi:hypothetical protein
MRYDGEVKWVPVRTAAKTLGVSMARVYQLIKTGELSSMKVDMTILVSIKSCDARQLTMFGEEKNAA